MSEGQSPQNRFLQAPPAKIFAQTAVPMILIMLMNGMLHVVDAAFLGHFVGAEAMSAIGVVFPLTMILIALSTLVSGGMSSLMARQLGAGAQDAAETTFARAHGLALTIAAVLIALQLLFGHSMINALSGGDPVIARMAYAFLTIVVLTTPVQFLLGIHADTCRNEGRAGMMAMMSLGVTLANIALNYLFIAVFDWGVAGSAMGSTVAQIFGLSLLVFLRERAGTRLPITALGRHSWRGGWKTIAGLGAPLSLSFIGVALSAFSAILAIRLTAGAAYAETVAAYGLVTRLMGFVFLPMMAMALATQSIVGNNAGAGQMDRVRQVLRIALGTALVYSLAVQIVFFLTGESLGRAFVDDPAVVAMVGTIIRPMTGFYLFTGPVLVLALYFQALGKPAQAALLTLVKPYLLVPAGIALAASQWGTTGIWYIYPVVDAVIAVIAGLVFSANSRSAAPATLQGAQP
ncbi:MATE family efflux transporter [Paracoccus aminophilus]|uniref:Multidrug export protein MepA n=1 Tax=Paracoccus aminophilus JCM 7686 TaxID=1367847 RepID=S5YH64_PARAH|nr:MATE family efflux transporter [Paracoccus aminophilus]AGT10808.1 multi antimicrobial extrusion protein MatE [Paracoccus aminophilus JCM 7686]